MATFPKPVRLGHLATLVPCEVIGDPDLELLGFRTLPRASVSDISFVTDVKHRQAAQQSEAGALLVSKALSHEGLQSALLVVDDPSLALAELLAALFPRPALKPGIHATAIIGDDCEIGAAEIGPYCVVGAGSQLADGVRLHPRVTLGSGCSLGPDTEIHPGAVLYDHVSVGARGVIHAGVVLGADGFGFTAGKEGPVKIPQVGRLVIGDDVEIGANSAIDRALLEETRIGSGTKIDNLVQVGHNVTVGKGCLLCGQAGVGGSSELGDYVVLGGQVGVLGHISVGDGTHVAAKSAVLQETAKGDVVAGNPAGPMGDWRRQSVAQKQLPKLLRRVAKLERDGSK